MSTANAKYLVRTCEDVRKLISFLLLPLDDCFDNARMIRSEIDEDIFDSSLDRLYQLHRFVQQVYLCNDKTGDYLP